MPNRTSQLHAYEYLDYLDAWQRLAEKDADTVAIRLPGDAILAGIIVRQISLPVFCQLRDDLFTAYQNSGLDKTQRTVFLEMALLFHEPCGTPEEAEAVQG